jgi:hypothetical protein
LAGRNRISSERTGIGPALSTPGGSVAAGGFAVEVASGDLGIAHLADAFTAFCLDIGHNLSLPSSYEATTTPFAGSTLSSAQRGAIRALFNTGYNPAQLGDANYSAGFQLALWEIVNETSGTYALGGGAFSATGFVGAISVANALLGNLGATTPTGNWRVVYLQSLDGPDRKPCARQPEPCHGCGRAAARGRPIAARGAWRPWRSIAAAPDGLNDPLFTGPDGGRPPPRPPIFILSGRRRFAVAAYL